MITKLFIPCILIQICLYGQVVNPYGSLSAQGISVSRLAGASAIPLKADAVMTVVDPENLSLTDEKYYGNEEATSGDAWWKSWWAGLIYLVLLTIAILTTMGYERKKNLLMYRLRLNQREAERLKEIDQLKMKYFTHVSEEFRTPLTLILGHVDHLLQKNWPEKDTQKLNRVLFRSKQLLFLVNQMLDISKLDTGSMKLQLSEHNIISFLKNIAASYETIARKKDITLRFNAFYYGLTMYFDTEKLEKILGNLLSNAIKFTPKGGMVTVLTRMVTTSTHSDDRIGKPPYVEILVQDSGMGILEEDLEHIFDRFYDKKGAHTGHKGSGIGLSLVKDLVELHHGILAVESTVGLGTAFTCWLPLDQTVYDEDDFAKKSSRQNVSNEFKLTTLDDPVSEEQDAIFLNDEVSREGEEDDQRKLVLVVDNNPDIREFIGEHLETNGYRINYAYDGESGLHRARETIPDLIVSDVRLPNLDGFLFCQMIRQDERTSHIPLIMLTAESSFESRIEGLESGADDYITKPFSSKELLIRVTNLIKIRSQLQSQLQSLPLMQPSETNVESMDQKFLKKVLNCIETHIEDDTFTVDQLGEDIGMSVNHLNRKLKALLGQTAGHFIRSIRLKRAAELLVKNAATVSEIAYQLGFNDPANFTRSFKREYGCSPVQYQQRTKVHGNGTDGLARDQYHNQNAGQK